MFCINHSGDVCAFSGDPRPHAHFRRVDFPTPAPFSHPPRPERWSKTPMLSPFSLLSSTGPGTGLRPSPSQQTDGRRKPLGGSSLLSPFSRGTHVPRAANQALPGTEWTPKLHFQSHCCSRSSSSLFPAACRNPNSVPREEPGAWPSGELWSLTFVKLFISWVIPHDSS